ncbi:MAG TPA: phospholipid carrier-dependent glycosyltransferase [Thermoanaerobaculia bacterium]|nr:phospholipid carrier-dependent glycosyltransferase [Thermoanaerobaculia bacterium]
MRSVRPHLARLVEWIVVGAVLMFSYSRGLDRVSFHEDESLWIACSLYFEAAGDEDFVPPEWFRESVRGTTPALTDRGEGGAGETWTSRLTWGPHYFSLDQPPVARYLIAIGRRLHGYETADLNRPWKFDLGPDENARLGNKPSPGLLRAARRSTAALSFASGLVLYGLVRRSAGRVAGFLFVFLYSTSGYLLVHLRRAMGDPALLFFTCLAMWAGTRALRVRDEAPEGALGGGVFRILAWLAAMGVAAGLAGGSKLNGLAVAVAGAVLACVLAFGGRGFGRGWRRLAFAAGASLLVLGSCAATFVAVNPSLHRRPVAHVTAMLELRARELAGHQRDPRWGLSTVSRRILVVAGRTLKTYTVTRVATLNVLLGGLGLLFLLRATWRWTKDGSGPAAAVVLLSVGIFTAGPALMTPLDWDRYYLYPVVFLTVLIAVGAATGPGEIRRFLAARAEAAHARRGMGAREGAP